MLKSHLDTSEKILLETSKIVNAAGHNIHKGTPREIFIRDFLQLNLAQDVGIGTGEIFDALSKPGDKRNQLDVVLFKKAFPRLHFGGEISAFMCESVIATIEIKSDVNKAALEQTITAAGNTKALVRKVAGPPTIYSILVGYDGPASINQIYTWIAEIHEEKKMSPIGLSPKIEERVGTPSRSVDVVVILGKGILYYDTSPIGFMPSEMRAKNPEIQWIWVDQPLGNLLFLFLYLTQVINYSNRGTVDLLSYLRDVNVDHIRYGTWVSPKN